MYYVLIDHCYGGVGGVRDGCTSVVVYESTCVLCIEYVEGVIMSDKDLCCGAVCSVVDVVCVGSPRSQVFGKCDGVIGVFGC